MITVSVDKNIGKIVLQTDDSSVRYLLEKTEKETKFVPYLKKYGTITRTIKIYDNPRVKPDKNGIWTFYLGLGWAGYIANVFMKFMSKQDYDQLLMDAVYAVNTRTVPFPELRDYQNDDILYCLKFKRGLVSVYTSYGKLSFASLGKIGEGCDS